MAHAPLSAADRKLLETTPPEALFAALKQVLFAKGLVAPEEIPAQIAQTERASPLIGAQIVARAWTDPAYRALLLAEPARAVEAFGVSLAGAPPLGVLENRPGQHHLIVCTLCSCYPRAVLGYPPFWYKSAAYRARAVRDPRGLLAEWGTVLPAGTEITVVDSTADYRWMVLPMRPSGTEGWDEARLSALVRVSDLIGMTVPEAPA